MGGDGAKSPTVREYSEWAQSEENCTIEDTFNSASLRLRRIIAPSGRHATIGGVLDDQVMSPITVTQTDRRLGLNSPFFKLPEPNAYSGSLH